MLSLTSEVVVQNPGTLERVISSIAAFGTVLAAVAAFLAAQRAKVAGEAAQESAEAGHTQAKASRKIAEASNEEVIVSRRALEASVRPLLASIRDTDRARREAGLTIRFPGRDALTLQELMSVFVEEGSGDRPTTHYAVGFRNIGPGLAVATSWGLRDAEGTSGPPGFIGASILSPGEMTYVSFSPSPEHAGYSDLLARPSDRDNFTVEVRYTDINGSQDTISQAQVRRREGRTPTQWYVRQVAFFNAGDSQPFAMSGPAD